MTSSRPLPTRKNLLLCLDAFGTLFTPNIPIPVAYARAAARHGIHIRNTKDPKEISTLFKKAFKQESQQNPNYGKATGMGAEKWWGNIIQNTFTPFLKPGQRFPPALTQELLQRFSSDEGYTLYSDVRPFFDVLRSARFHSQHQSQSHQPWPWDKTIVGIITNSDARVPGILQAFGLSIGPRRYSPPDQDPDKNEIVEQPSLNTNEEHDISFVVLSYDVGYEKPDEGIFKAAEAMLSLTLENDAAQDYEKLYVGDDFKKDYLGAEAAGWERILLVRERKDAGKRTGIQLAQVEDEEGKMRFADTASSLLDLSGWRPKRNWTQHSTTI
jgi:FMN phosphatase YigB (HAD superfamily)